MQLQTPTASVQTTGRLAPVAHPSLWGAALTSLLSFAVYLSTLAPTITLRNHGADSGDLVTAAINLGVPHPTGYPLYIILSHLMTRLPGGDAAYKVNLLSAAAAALALGILFHIIYRRLPTALSVLLRLLVCSGAVGLFAFGQLLWSQATIAEVYAFHVLVMVSLLWVIESRHPLRPCLAALFLALSVGHHLTAALVIPTCWPFIGDVRRSATLTRMRRVAVCFVAGLIPYLYIPLRARANPVPNWGYGDNWEGILWLVTGAPYHSYLRLPATESLQRFTAWSGIWVRDLGVLGLALALFGLWDTFGQRTTRAELTYVALVSCYAITYSTSDSYLYLLPVGIVLCCWLAHGAAQLLGGLQQWAGTNYRKRLVVGTAALALAMLPLRSLVRHHSAMDLSGDWEAHTYAQTILAAAQPGALILSEGDEQTFALWYQRYGLGLRADTSVVDRRLLAFAWYRRAVSEREASLRSLSTATDAQSALSALIREAGRSRPIQLTAIDESLQQSAGWDYETPLYTLRRGG